MDAMNLRECMGECPLSEIEREYIRDRLIMCYMLQVVCDDMMFEIKQKLDERSKYRHDIKHDYKEIKAAICRVLKKGHFAEKLSDDAIDILGKEADHLKDILCDMFIITKDNDR